MNILRSRWYNVIFYPGSQKYIISILSSLLFAMVLGLFIPLQINKLFSSFGVENEFWNTLVSLFFIFLGEYLNRVVYQFAISGFIRDNINLVRTFCYERWLYYHEGKYQAQNRQSLKDDFPLGEVLARLINDTEALRELVSSGSFSIFIDAIFIVSSLISFISINSFTAIFFIVIEVCVCLLLIKGGKWMAEVFYEVRKTNGIVARTIADITNGLHDLFYTPHNHYGLSRGKKSFDLFLKAQLNANIWDASYYSMAESLFPLLLVVLVFIIPFAGLQNLAVVAVIVDLIQRSIRPITEFTGKISNIQRALSGIKRLDEFVDHLEKGQLKTSTTNFTSKEIDHVKLEDVTYSYPNVNNGYKRKIFSLKKINFNMESGQLIGIVGESGSGKSSLLSLIAGDLFPQEGKITLSFKDNTQVSIPEHNFLNLHQYAECIGLITQDSHIFSSTIRFNITLKQTLNEQESNNFEHFWRQINDALPYIKRWKIQPTDYILSRSLSLGQKQLLCALRSCYLKRQVVLYDEMSSGLDSDLEYSLRKLILMIQKQSITIIVAHRIETIVKANKIVVMDQGKIIGHGTHEELIQSSLQYKNIIDEIGQST